MQNFGDAQLCREIVASIEHTLTEKAGEWRVSIAGSNHGRSCGRIDGWGGPSSTRRDYKRSRVGDGNVFSPSRLLKN
jgi:hypothetical protein